MARDDDYTIGYDVGYGDGYRAGKAAASDALKQAEEALRNLCDKLDEITEATVGIFTMAAIRGNEYSGPNYEAELVAARAALSRITRGEP